jgi:hypothetical protein
MIGFQIRDFRIPAGLILGRLDSDLQFYSSRIGGNFQDKMHW